jgi:hypothetical protein
MAVARLLPVSELPKEKIIHGCTRAGSRTPHPVFFLSEVGGAEVSFITAGRDHSLDPAFVTQPALQTDKNEASCQSRDMVTCNLKTRRTSFLRKKYQPACDEGCGTKKRHEPDLNRRLRRDKISSLAL